MFRMDSSITKHLPVPSLKREFQGDYQSSPQTLHVLQWNVLAQGTDPPGYSINAEISISHLGLSNPIGNFVRVKAETVAYETRKWRILEQILIRQPDLCALEEVDIYDCFLQHQLPNYGYLSASLSSMRCYSTFKDTLVSVRRNRCLPV